MVVERNLLRLSDQEWMERGKRAGYKINKLAAEAGCCVKQLERFFRKHKGMNPSRWFRMQKALQAFADVTADESVKGAAYNVGYKSVQHLCHDFKLTFGITASQAAFGVQPLRNNPAQPP